MQRTIEAPEKEWLTAREAAKWLGISVSTFLRMVEAGTIPEGRLFYRNTRRWKWDTVWWISHGLQVGLLKPREEPAK